MALRLLEKVLIYHIIFMSMFTDNEANPDTIVISSDEDQLAPMVRLLMIERSQLLWPFY